MMFPRKAGAFFNPSYNYYLFSVLTSVDGQRVGSAFGSSTSYFSLPCYGSIFGENPSSDFLSGSVAKNS
jgi:hypothetical protein